MKPGLGTQLRHLIDLLDGAVEAAYAKEGLDYRPRYTPIMRALIEHEPRTIGEIAKVAGILQPAATQTVSLMAKAGLLKVEVGARDGRQRLVSLSKEGRRMIPRLQRCWQATSLAAASLDQELPFPLSELLSLTLAALERQSFSKRLARARATLSTSPTSEAQAASPIAATTSGSRNRRPRKKI